jgi:hypothetical protein
MRIKMEEEEEEEEEEEVSEFGENVVDGSWKVRAAHADGALEEAAGQRRAGRPPQAGCGCRQWWGATTRT